MRNYIRGSSVAIVVYDITNVESFESVERWINTVRNERGTNVLIIVVGNKTDLEDERVVSAAQGQKKCTDLNVLFLETSAKNGHNIASLLRWSAMDLPEVCLTDQAMAREVVQITSENNVKDESKSKCRC